MKGRLKEKGKKIYHVSMDVSLEEKLFSPRIPKFTTKGEDVSMKRVCFAETIEGAIRGVPSKGCLANDVLREGYAYLNVFEVNKDEVAHKSNEEILHLVPDAHLTGEYWVTEELRLKPSIIKINNLIFSHYNGYTNQPHGFVKELDYEQQVEEYEREETIQWVGRSFVRKAMKWATTNGIPYEVLDESRDSLWHIRFCLENSVSYRGTTKKYSIKKIKFSIPPGADISGLWSIHYEQERYLKKANLRNKIARIKKNEDWFLEWQDSF